MGLTSHGGRNGFGVYVPISESNTCLAVRQGVAEGDRTDCLVPSSLYGLVKLFHTQKGICRQDL